MFFKIWRQKSEPNTLKQLFYGFSLFIYLKKKKKLAIDFKNHYQIDLNRGCTTPEANRVWRGTPSIKSAYEPLEAENRQRVTSESSNGNALRWMWRKV